MNPNDLVEMEKTVSEAREGFKVNRFINLKIGGGKTPGYSILDLGGDINHHVDNTPYPLDDQSCESILLNHQISKISPSYQIESMNEFHRLLVVGGILLINTFYGLNDHFVSDPENSTPWNDKTPLFFCPYVPTFLNTSGEPEPSVYFNKKCKPWELIKLTWNRHFDMKVGMKKI